MRFQFGGFANVTHFKKWYKKAGLAILDCMLLNSYIAWNLSAGDRLRSRRRKLSRYGFYTIVAQMMCSYRTPQEVDPLARRTTNTERPAPCAHDHYPVAIEDKKQVACAVCLLEYRWKKDTMKMAGIYKNVGRCAKCGICAHLVGCQSRAGEGWKIHSLPQFKTMTCFEIVHCSEGQEIFVAAEEGARYTYTVRKNHETVAKLREDHGLQPSHSRKRSAVEFRMQRRQIRQRADEVGDDADEVGDDDNADKMEDVVEDNSNSENNSDVEDTEEV